MHITLCAITKGDSEYKSIKRAVESVYDHVDEVQITTNSKKYDKVRSWCEKDPKMFHSHRDWDKDFSAARNFNFSQVSDKTDYIVWLDSDDVIVNPHLIRDIAKISKKSGYDTVFFAYWYGAKFDGDPSIDTFIEQEITHYRERLIRPGSLVWKKRIHETPVPLDDANFKYSRVEYSEEYPLAWMHLGADRDIDPKELQARMDRNQEILEMELVDERAVGDADPRTLLYLMKIYAESEDPEVLEVCIEMGEEYMTKSGWDQERAVCLQLMAKCYGMLGNNELARDILHNAIKEYPHTVSLYLYLAKAYFNLQDFPSMKHWMDIAVVLDQKEDNTGMYNILENKLMLTELWLLYSHHAKRNPRDAYSAAVVLNRLNPIKENQANVDYLYNQKELDIASEHAHKLMQYLVSIEKEDLIEPLVESFPESMQELPFARKYYNRYREPRTWWDNEICYFANFGGDHFEKWSPDNLKTGIGGSETAVIRLSQEWSKMGYAVTVYGDPPQDKIGLDENNIDWQPWYAFNHRDKFNIFIQWRNNNLAKHISAKKFLVDLHDVFHENTHLPTVDQVDKIMVKSKFHRNYAKNIPDDKMEVISNGI